MDGIARGKLGLVSIGGVLHNPEGLTLLSFSSFIGVIDSNEVEILALFEAQRLVKASFHQTLIMESDSLITI